MNKFFVAEGQVINLEAIIHANMNFETKGMDIYLIEDKVAYLYGKESIQQFQNVCISYTQESQSQ